MSPRSVCTSTAAGGLVAIAAVHVLWAAGSAWPARDRAALADAVIGRAELPPASACLAVAGLLSCAGMLVGGYPRGRPALSRAGSGAVVVVLTARAALGLTDNTRVLSAGSSSPRFRRLDRRLYSPLCLTLAALASPAALTARQA